MTKTVIPNIWQEEALDKYRHHDKEVFCAEVTMGGGKTLFSGFCFEHQYQENLVDFAIIVVPGTVIKGDADSGFLGDWHKLELEITTVLKDKQNCPTEFCGAVITYSQLPHIISTLETWKNVDSIRIMAVFDEVHHCTDNIWGQSAERLAHIATKVVAMTGTPFRGDGKRISFLRYDATGKVLADFSYSYRAAVRDEICRPVEFMTDDGLAEFVWANEDPSRVDISAAKKESDLVGVARTIFRGDSRWLERTVERAIDCLNEYRIWDPDAALLVVCRPGDDEYEQRYLFQVAKIVRGISDEEPVIVAYDDTDSAAKIEAFRKARTPVICAVRKISEGCDIKRIRVVLIATRITSELLLRQIAGRAMRVDDDSNPGNATIFIPKFTQMVEWASVIAGEAATGLKEQTKTGGGGGGGSARRFTALGSQHREGGAVSDFGDKYSSAEINTAERVRQDDPQLLHVPITTLAYILRKAGVEADPAQTPQEPKQITKKSKRKEIVRLQRRLAQARNSLDPDFSRVMRELEQHTGAKDLDDLTNNFSLEVMERAIALLKDWLANTNTGPLLDTSKIRNAR